MLWALVATQLHGERLEYVEGGIDVPVAVTRACTAGAVLESSIRSASWRALFEIFLPVNDVLQHVAADMTRLRSVVFVNWDDV